MFPGRIVGRVVASQKDPGLVGVKLLLVQTTDWLGKESGDPVIAVDTVGAGSGEFVFFVKSREAAMSLTTVPPVDAAIVGIIDDVTLEES